MSIESRRMYIHSYGPFRDPFQTGVSETATESETLRNLGGSCIAAPPSCRMVGRCDLQLVDVVPFAAAFCWPSTAVISPRKTLLEAKAISRPARQSSQPVLRMANAWRKRIPLLWDNTQTTCMDVLQGHKSKMISNCLEKKRKKKLTSLEPFTVLYLQRMFHHRHHFVARNRVPTSFALPRSEVSSVSVGSWCLPSRGQRRPLAVYLLTTWVSNSIHVS